MPSARPLILLPPSEGKSVGGRGAPWHRGSMSFPELDERRANVMDALVAASGAGRARNAELLGVTGEALDRAVEANRAVAGSGTTAAIRRYTGVLYDELSWATLDAPARRHGNRQVVIFSGLWGVVRPTDPIPLYKLKMGAKLGRLGTMNRWWREAVSSAVSAAAPRRAPIWNLLPHEHATALRADGRPRITVKFLDDVDRAGGRSLVSVSHWNKLLKGALVRHLLETGLDEPDGLARFDHPLGYRYRPDLTSTEGATVTVSMVARR